MYHSAADAALAAAVALAVAAAAKARLAGQVAALVAQHDGIRGEDGRGDHDRQVEDGEDEAGDAEGQVEVAAGPPRRAALLVGAWAAVGEVCAARADVDLARVAAVARALLRRARKQRGVA